MAREHSTLRKLTPAALALGVIGAIVGLSSPRDEPPAVHRNTALVEESVERATSSAPHIVFFLVDDMGHNDIGYQSTDISNASPFLDELAWEGVKLTRYYTEYECTPARAALMTGKLPIKLGLQHECVTPTAPFGLKQEEYTMGDHLREGAGYRTHIVGKWDLGHYALQMWPTFRGFDTFFGLTCYGFNDYFTHENKGFWDLHDWDAIHGRKNADSASSGVYSTFLLGARARDIIKAHPPAAPLFLYLPFNAVHNTLSVPDEWAKSEEAQAVMSSLTYDPRADLAGALYLVDKECKGVVDSLKDKGMYQNTVIVTASDNGGSPVDGGNNWPLRGAKKTMFEGGHRVPCFLHSPLLSKEVRGTSFHGLVHVTDWVPTLVLGAAGVTTMSEGRQAALDGFNLWAEFNKAGGSSPRKEVLLNIDYVSQLVDSVPVDDITQVWMGLVMEVNGKLYKLILNQYDYAYYTPVSNSPSGTVRADYWDFLFDLTDDEAEKHNLLEHMAVSEKKHNMKDLIFALSERMCHFYEQMVPTQYKDADSSAKRVMMQGNGGFVTHWMDYDDTVQPALKLDLAPKCDANVLAKYLYAKHEDTNEDDELGNDDTPPPPATTTHLATPATLSMLERKKAKLEHLATQSGQKMALRRSSTSERKDAAVVSKTLAKVTAAQ